MLTRKSLYKDYINLLKANNACQEAIDFAESIDSENYTVGEGMDEFLSRTEWQGWGAWNLKVLFKEFDPELRANFIEKIKDPMMALAVYLKIKDLSDEEDALLEAKFKDKLPNAEKQLEDEIVVREKTKAVL